VLTEKTINYSFSIIKQPVIVAIYTATLSDSVYYISFGYQHFLTLSIIYTLLLMIIDFDFSISGVLTPLSAIFQLYHGNQF
jgi:hypothetical protein